MITNVVDKAFRILKRNYSCPGPDELSYQEIKKDYNFHRQKVVNLYSTQYKATLPRAVDILEGKRTIKKRTIYVYNIYDRWFQMCLKLIIKPTIDSTLSPHVYAARNGKNRKQLYNYFCVTKPKYIVIFDIVKYYSNINRDILAEQLLSLDINKNIVRLINTTFSHKKKGLPLGNSLSSMLANLYLTDLDKSFQDNYARFSDDIFIGLNNKEKITPLITQIESKLKKYYLQLNYDKIILVEKPAEKKFILEYPWFENAIPLDIQNNNK